MDYLGDFAIWAAAEVAAPGPPGAASPPPATAAAAVAAFKFRPDAAAGRPAEPGPPVLQDAFIPLAGAQPRAPSPFSQPGPAWVPLLVPRLRRHVEPGAQAPHRPIFCPHLRGRSSGAVDCRGHLVAPATHCPAG